MEGINKPIRSHEELKEAGNLATYLKGLAFSHGGVDVEPDRIDELVQQFEKGEIATLEELEARGNAIIDSMQGDH